MAPVKIVENSREILNDYDISGNTLNCKHSNDVKLNGSTWKVLTGSGQRHIIKYVQHNNKLPAGDFIHTIAMNWWWLWQWRMLASFLSFFTYVEVWNRGPKSWSRRQNKSQVKSRVHLSSLRHSDALYDLEHSWNDRWTSSWRSISIQYLTRLRRSNNTSMNIESYYHPGWEKINTDILVLAVGKILSLSLLHVTDNQIKVMMFRQEFYYTKRKCTCITYIFHQ